MLGILILLSVTISGLAYIIGARRLAERLLLVALLLAILGPALASEWRRTTIELSGWSAGIGILLGFALIGLAYRRSADHQRERERERGTKTPTTSLKRRMESL